MTGIGTEQQTKLKPLENKDFKFPCKAVLNSDTLVICDSNITCYVYYFQNGEPILKNSFSPTPLVLPSQAPLTMTLSDDNLLLSSFNLRGNPLVFYGVKHDINWFGFVQQCITLTDKLGVSIGFLLDFIKLADIGMVLPNDSNNVSKNNSTYASYENYANKLENTLQIGLSDEEWESIYLPLEDGF